MKLDRANRRLIGEWNLRRSTRTQLAAALAVAVCLALLAPAPALGASPATGAHWNSEGRGYQWVGALMPGLDELNDRLEVWDFPKLRGTVVMFGGGGYGAWENWRIGGFGAAGALASREGLKRAELSLGFGGLQVVRVWPLGGVQLELGILAGGGGSTLMLSEGKPEDLDDAFGNRWDTVIDSGFLFAGPSAGARIDLAPHIGLIVSAGYIYTVGGWEHRGSQAELSGLPDLNGAFFQVGLTLGGHGVRRR